MDNPASAFGIIHLSLDVFSICNFFPPGTHHNRVVSQILFRPTPQNFAHMHVEFGFCVQLESLDQLRIPYLDQLCSFGDPRDKHHILDFVEFSKRGESHHLSVDWILIPPKKCACDKKPGLATEHRIYSRSPCIPVFHVAERSGLSITTKAPDTTETDICFSAFGFSNFKSSLTNPHDVLAILLFVPKLPAPNFRPYVLRIKRFWDPGQPNSIRSSFYFLLEIP
jgi:hypothetical protein